MEYEIRNGEIVYADHGPVGVLVTEQHLGQTAEPSLSDLRAALIAVYGTDYGIHSPTSISRFTDAARQAASYRNGRVLIAGDANLGWKLAQVVKRTSPDCLLDTYQAERHPIGAREDERTKALRDTIAELLGMDEPRRRFAATLSGLDIHYDLGEGHPQLGRRIPDLDLVTENGALRVFTLLHDARPVLLNLGVSGGFDLAPWADRVKRVDAKYPGVWELPALGPIAAPSAVLIRPDGYVAWVGGTAQPGLADALTAWFGCSAADLYRV